MKDFFVLVATDLGPQDTYKIYILLSENLDPQCCQYFSKPGYRGHSCFIEQDFEVLDHSIKGCKARFVACLEPPRNEYCWLIELDEDDIPEWIKER